VSVALIDLILAAAAALFFGLWWGEKGRREAAERWKVYGTPEPVTAPRGAPVESAGPPRVGSPEFEEAVERGAARLEASAPDGYHLTRDEWREEARRMLTEGLAG